MGIFLSKEITTSSLKASVLKEIADDKAQPSVGPEVALNTVSPSLFYLATVGQSVTREAALPATPSCPGAWQRERKATVEESAGHCRGYLVFMATAPSSTPAFLPETPPPSHSEAGVGTPRLAP